MFFESLTQANSCSDFQNVDHWEDNKLDRTQSSRMGWSDISLSLTGPVVQDLRTHFAQRWNFIYDEKYGKKDTRYQRVSDAGGPGAQQGGFYPPPPTQQRDFDGEEGERGFGGEGEEGDRGLFGHRGGFRERIHQEYEEHYGQQHHGDQQQYQSHAGHSAQRGGVECQDCPQCLEMVP